MSLVNAYHCATNVELKCEPNAENYVMDDILTLDDVFSPPDQTVPSQQPCYDDHRGQMKHGTMQLARTQVYGSYF